MTTKAISRSDYSNKKQYGQDESQVLLLKLDNNRRRRHTATSNYRICMASLQPDSIRQPYCSCSIMNQDYKLLGRKDDKHNDTRVLVIVEHDLKEYILCILDSQKVTQCKLDLYIQAGEQIAFRTLGKTPVLLTGIIDLKSNE